jgi:CBS domain-containing protein
MRPLAPLLTVAPGDPLADALEKLAQNGLGRAAVIENGALVGYLSLRDILHVLAISDSEVTSRRAGGA